MKYLTSFFVLLLLALSVSADEPAKIGYVDMQQVLDKSKMGQQAQATLKEKFAGKQESFSKEGQEIQQLQQALAQNEALMSQKELDKKKGEIQKRMTEYQKQASAAQQELVKEQNKLGVEILKPAQEVVAEVAKEKNISAVLERRQSGLLYIDEGLDLTADVISKLDARAGN